VRVEAEEMLLLKEWGNKLGETEAVSSGFRLTGEKRERTMNLEEAS
jgi:hypothetical protein